jgi:hypothetical protein
VRFQPLEQINRGLHRGGDSARKARQCRCGDFPFVAWKILAGGRLANRRGGAEERASGGGRRDVDGVGGRPHSGRERRGLECRARGAGDG